jgi:ABC-type multidrug transport system ATPase subunit
VLSEPSPAVHCDRLTVTVSRRAVVEDVGVDLAGGVYGLLGPNGAGKTTLLRTLATALSPASGTLRLLGADVATVSGAELRRVRRDIGFAPQQPVALGHLSVRDQVAYAAWLKEVPSARRTEAVAAAIAAVNLQEQATQKVRTLSGGMLRRLGIAMALVHTPQLVLLDEPTAGLDPEQRVDFRRLVTRLGGTATVVLSTHLVEDVAVACDRVGVMAAGRIVFDGKVDELVARGADVAADGRSPVEAGFAAVVGGAR